MSYSLTGTLWRNWSPPNRRHSSRSIKLYLWEQMTLCLSCSLDNVEGLRRLIIAQNEEHKQLRIKTYPGEQEGNQTPTAARLTHPSLHNTQIAPMHNHASTPSENWNTVRGINTWRLLPTQGCLTPVEIAKKRPLNTSHTYHPLGFLAPTVTRPTFWALQFQFEWGRRGAGGEYFRFDLAYTCIHKHTPCDMLKE